MGIKVSNNAYGTLSASINDTATTITLNSGEGARFPSLGASDYFYATLIDTGNNLEVIKVTARSVDTLTVVRGQDGTTARSYALNDRMELRPVAALFDNKQDTLPAGTVGQVLLYSVSGWAPADAPGFPAGTRLAFQQSSAPTGWTKDTNSAINDAILRLVTGSVSSGGSVGWSVATTGATTLSTAQIPSHTHTYVNGGLTKGGGAISGLASGNYAATQTNNSGATGGGGSHTHSLANGCKYYDFIIASKN